MFDVAPAPNADEPWLSGVTTQTTVDMPATTYIVTGSAGNTEDHEPFTRDAPDRAASRLNVCVDDDRSLARARARACACSLSLFTPRSSDDAAREEAPLVSSRNCVTSRPPPSHRAQVRLLTHVGLQRHPHSLDADLHGRLAGPGAVRCRVRRRVVRPARTRLIQQDGDAHRRVEKTRQPRELGASGTTRRDTRQAKARSLCRQQARQARSLHARPPLPLPEQQNMPEQRRLRLR